MRLRYATDAAFQERGWFADDFSVTADGATTWSDDVEGGDNGWTADNTTFTGTHGAGWIRTSGTFSFEQYYLAEWRTYDGFDNGLKYGVRHEHQPRWRAQRRVHAVQRARAC